MNTLPNGENFTRNTLKDLLKIGDIYLARLYVEKFERIVTKRPGDEYHGPGAK